MKALFYIVIILSASEIFPQDILKEQFDYASSLYAEGKYFDSITEFKRLQYFDSTGIYKVKSSYLMGGAYKKGGFYIEAIKYLSNALYETPDQDSIYMISAEIIKSNILRRTTFRALVLLQELENTVTDTVKLKEINLLRGFAYAFSEEWDSAAVYFDKGGDNYLEQLSSRAEDEYYSEVKAKIFSVILPGAGQIYTGNYINGLISFLLNAATIYLTADAFVSDRIFDGVMTGNFLWLRFYLGNIYNAGKFAAENSRVISERTYMLMQEYKGYTLH